tara:strand:- start:31 stop:315 length:285 start_codon:yes stop_codon:yes gene_type:complete
MNLGRHSKSISFIGLLFFASISLHSFAHIDESPLENHAEFECQSCQNEISPDIEFFEVKSEVYFTKPIAQEGSRNLYLQLNKPFSAQAPPKIII